mgnify:CR=1 FL=1
MGDASGRFWRRTGAGLAIAVRLTPRAARDRVDGVTAHGDRVHLAVRVRAVPEKGKANAALEKLIAELIGVPASDVRVEAGGRSRLKTVGVAGDVQALERKLLSVLAADADNKNP